MYNKSMKILCDTLNSGLNYCIIVQNAQRRFDKVDNEEIIKIQNEAENKTIETSDKEKSDFKTKFRKFRKSWFAHTLSTIFILAILAALGAGYAIVETESDPKIVAVEYFNGYISGNWDAIYPLVDGSDNSSLGVESFAKVMSDSMNGDINEYELGDPQKYEDGVVFNIKYQDMVTEEDKVFELKLKKQKKKLFQLVNKWKVDLSEIEASNLKVMIPEGTQLYINNEKVDNPKTETIDEVKKMVYYVEDIYLGNHNMIIRSDYTKDIIKEVEVTENYQKFDFSDSELNVNEDIVNELKEFNKETMKQMYTNASNKKSYKAIIDLFPEDKTLRKNVKSFYNTMVNQIYREDIATEEYKVDQLVFGDFDIKYANFSMPDTGKIRVDFTYNFEVSRETTYYDSYTGTYSGEYKVGAIYTIKLSQDGWTIQDIKIVSKKIK